MWDSLPGSDLILVIGVVLDFKCFIFVFQIDLGLRAGIIEPIKSGIRDPRLGIGKQEEDDFFTAEENIQRKKLDVELEETEEHVKKREV